MDVFHGFLTVMDEAILPSVSLLSCNCGISEELWSMLKQLPYERRSLSPTSCPHNVTFLGLLVLCVHAVYIHVSFLCHHHTQIYLRFAFVVLSTSTSVSCPSTSVSCPSLGRILQNVECCGFQYRFLFWCKVTNV